MVWPITEIPDPSRPNDRMDMVDPYCTKSMAEVVNPKRTVERTEIVDPRLGSGGFSSYQPRTADRLHCVKEYQITLTRGHISDV